MPVVSEYNHVREIYRQAAELGIGLPVFCAEDRETLEAILAAAYEYGREIGVDDLPVIPAWTCRYPARSQMMLVTACGDPRLGTELMFSDLKAFTGETSPYRKLRIMPHLDHAFPWLDGDILLEYADRFASVMHDASERPFSENIRLTAEYVERVRGKVVVEGAVDEILEAGEVGVKNELTTPEQAARFLKETGVDIIVPNVGTEHRATAESVKYMSGRAKEISSKVGKILCLHGTSSVRPEELHRLPDDGFIKINLYTTIAVSGGQAVARNVLQNLGNIFDGKQLEAVVEEEILGKKAFYTGCDESGTFIKPKLKYVCNPLRRDAWLEAVKNRCKGFFETFNYKMWRI